VYSITLLYNIIIDFLFRKTFLNIAPVLTASTTVPNPQVGLKVPKLLLKVRVFINRITLFPSSQGCKQQWKGKANWKRKWEI
jgi:hypothetical protein